MDSSINDVLKAHLFSIPLLTTPALSLCIDQTCSCSTAARIFGQKNLLVIDGINNLPGDDLQSQNHQTSYPGFAAHDV